MAMSMQRVGSASISMSRGLLPRLETVSLLGYGYFGTRYFDTVPLCTGSLYRVLVQSTLYRIQWMANRNEAREYWTMRNVGSKQRV